MAETSDQVRPLAPSTAASDRHTSSDEEEAAQIGIRRRRRRCVRCSVCVATVLLIIAVTAIALIFTVFRVRDPIIRMNGVTVDKLDILTGNIPLPGTNITLIADVSVKNPNYASFRYENTTTALFYRGSVIGEARGPPGKAKARRTMRMNITVDVMADRVLARPELTSDIGSGLLPISSYTEVGGKVRMAVVNRHVTVRMNCSMMINITSQAIQEQKCRRKVKL